MKTGAKLAIVGGVVFALIALVTVVKFVGYNNTEIELRTQFDAQVKVNESYYDKMWKILSQQAQVADKYSKDFKSIYTGIMEGRYSKGGAMMKWIQERNPNFDTSLYKKLMISIEAQREGFHREQKKTLDIVRTHDNLRQKFPSNLIVGGADKLEWTVISSSRAKEVMATGIDDDVKVFN